MKLWILFIFYGVLAVAVESVWHLPGHFLLFAVIYLSFYEEWRPALALSLFFGFILDVTSISPMGTGFFSFGIIFALIRFFKNKILFQTWLSRFLWVALISFVYQWLVVGFVNGIGGAGFLFSIFLPRLFLTSFADGILGLFWLPALVWYRHLGWKELVKQQDILLKK